MIEFIAINKANSKHVNLLKPAKNQLHLVHYNAHWYGQSMLCNNIYFYLIESKKNFVGVIALGQFYNDAYLQETIKDTAEIIHIIIDHRFQSKGYGTASVKKAKNLLFDLGYKNIVAAIATKNDASQKLFKACGFKITSGKNYDGDDLYEYQAEQM